ncbi:cyanate transporter [Chromobacterium sp. S0633]|uniref:cyanate transporter n=1 Tax=Chromobacterium sp. S0633 TaxID=2957805 RepID=UPI00209D659C|nr:cyanate transporter [Chromobacterium sp. S0633]MCP1289979.1 cyanate transporter [Chromobacterium sp. S0633]
MKQDTSVQRPLWLALSIILVGLNLRPALAAIGPLLDQLRHATGMSFSDASLLTTLPVATMGAGAFLGSWLERRAGARLGVVIALLLIFLSSALRWLPASFGALLATALMAGIGIALAQALIPGFIKQYFPHKVSALMGFYITAIMGGASLAAAGAPWLAAHSAHWQNGLAAWAALAALALPCWLLSAPRRAPGGGSAARAPQFSRIPRAWLLAFYFGIGTAVYASSLAWLPALFVQLGWSQQQGGLMLSFMTGMEVVSGLTIPLLSARSHDMRGWLTLVLLAVLAGLLGMVLAPHGGLLLLWVALLGLGVGGLFPLTMILTLHHYEDARNAGQLSAFVQGIGYLIAAVAPFAAGWIRDATSSFNLAWLCLALLIASLLVLTRRFAPQGYAEAMQNPAVVAAQPR